MTHPKDLLKAWLVCCIATTLFANLSVAEDRFDWRQQSEAGTTDLMFGDKPVIQYVHRFDERTAESTHDTYKVFHHVFGPQSGERITKGPGGQYTHHRGLFIGWNKTRVEGGGSYDFWHCKNGVHLRHVEFNELEADADQGTMTATIHWNDADGSPVIIETRTVTVTREPETDGWQIDWSTKLSAQRSSITLDGDRQHAGFQFRAQQAVAESNAARYLRPEAFPQQPAAIQVGDAGDPPKHINLGWFAMSYPLGDSRYTVEYFDNPNLPKPSLFSERPYGRFGTFFKTTLKQGEPLVMRYRIVVTEGETPSVEAIQDRYDAFVDALPAAENE